MGEKPPVSMLRQRDSTIGLNFDRSSLRLASSVEKLSGGRRWMSSAKKVKMQRMRNGVTTSNGVIFLKRAGEVGEVRSDIPGDAGGDAAGVEGERVGPDGAEAVAIAGAPVRRGGYGG